MATANSAELNRRDTRTAGKAGLGLAAAGIVVFNVAPFLNWVHIEDADFDRVGYETDSLVPFIAYLGLACSSPWPTPPSALAADSTAA